MYIPNNSEVFTLSTSYTTIVIHFNDNLGQYRFLFRIHRFLLTSLIPRWQYVHCLFNMYKIAVKFN